VKTVNFHTLVRLVAAMTLCAGLISGTSADAIQGAAPDFTLKSQTGTNLKLSELRGQVVLINFWASWCGPCRQEMPALDELYQHYRSLDFTVLGVNVEENSANAKSLLKDIHVTFPVLFDNQNTVSKLYNIKGMPSTILVDRDGNMRYLHMGYQPGFETEYQNQVRTLIRE
jgi:peroxiredoxin